MSQEPPLNTEQLSDEIESINAALASGAEEPLMVAHEIGHMLGPLARLAIAMQHGPKLGSTELGPSAP